MKISRKLKENHLANQKKARRVIKRMSKKEKEFFTGITFDMENHELMNRLTELGLWENGGISSLGLTVANSLWNENLF